jgi:hypothetical protein
MPYVKGMLGGLGGAIILSMAYLALKAYGMYLGIRAARAEMGVGGGELGAIAGGLSYLLRDPLLLVLALTGFGLGFYLIVSRPG